MISSLASAGTDPPLKKRAHETSLTGCTKNEKNNHKQDSRRQFDPNQVCHILIYTSHSGTAYIYIFLDFFLGLAGRGVGSEFSALLSSQRITAVNSKTDSPLARRQRSGHALGQKN